LTKEDFLNGQLLLIDKPLGWSSFQAVNKLKWAIRKKFQLKKIKIGHAGTLDPLATGLLIICTGKFTKRIPEFQGLVRKTTEKFLGDIQQAPPIFSALKKDGKRLYEYAREGKEVEIKKRAVHIQEFQITAVQLPEVTFRIVCSKGTYIRSIAHDFGLALGSGAHLSALRRTKIGDYNVNIAQDPEVFEKQLLEET